VRIRLVETAQQLLLLPDSKTRSQLLVCALGTESIPAAAWLAPKLRTTGINTEIYPDPQAKLDKQLKYANKKGIPFVAIIGEDEVKTQSVTLKNMASGEQTSYSSAKPEDIAAYVQKPPVL